MVALVALATRRVCAAVTLALPCCLASRTELDVTRAVPDPAALPLMPEVTLAVDMACRLARLDGVLPETTALDWAARLERSPEEVGFFFAGAMS